MVKRVKSSFDKSIAFLNKRFYMFWGIDAISVLEVFREPAFGDKGTKVDSPEEDNISC